MAEKGQEYENNQAQKAEKQTIWGGASVESYQLSADSRRAIVIFLIGLFSAFAADTFMYFGLWVLMILMDIIFIACCIGIINSIRRRDKHEWRKRKYMNEKFKQYEDAFRKIQKELDRKADKPIVNNVRPGSRPSEAYYILKGEKANDGRTENQTAPTVQTGMVEGRAGDNARKAE